MSAFAGDSSRMKYYCQRKLASRGGRYKAIVVDKESYLLQMSRFESNYRQSNILDEYSIKQDNTCMSIQTFTLTLDWAKMLTPHVRHLAFKCDEDRLWAFTPGQFLSIHFPVNDKMLKRSYSIATIPGQSTLIEIAAGYVANGPGTELIFSLQPGDKITASGPYGRLVLREENPERYILIATSTGVTPYRAMLPELAKRLINSDLEVILLLGIQTRTDLLYLEDFLAFAKQHPNFTFRAHYSRENLTDRQPYEFQGYVQSAFDELKLNVNTDIIYLCGNPNMIDNAFEQLKALGFDTKNVRREKYIS